MITAPIELKIDTIEFSEGTAQCNFEGDTRYQGQL